MSTHYILTEPSPQMHPGKGREGKGRGKEGGCCPSMTSGSSPTRPGFVAMCQGCHLHYDREHHAKTRAASRALEQAAQMDGLF